VVAGVIVGDGPGPRLGIAAKAAKEGKSAEEVKQAAQPSAKVPDRTGVGKMVSRPQAKK
jgi:hypothetical protein